ncbi:MAG: flagellar hook-basal body complex protein [Ruminococcus sp.]|nr:flagellar hook-basal body complex protein [Ruminococcus sp.]MCM1479010.1 flagellar hook-basal body complex protein [Muribaculaceae bacterium]
MLRGYYTAANGIINEQRILNVITNNLANAKTAGYKSDEAIPTTFEEKLLLMRNGRRSETGNISYRTIEVTDTNLEQGTMENTQSRLDMALVGNVYFNIEERRTGERLLSRNGQFTINGEGFLTLGTTGYVLDENGERIQLNNSADIIVDRFGEITTADGRTINLGLSFLDPEVDVEKVDDNLMRPYEDTPIGNIPADAIYQVRQGWYERSNVNVAEETIRAMDAQQVFTACSSGLKIADSINQMAVNLCQIN